MAQGPLFVSSGDLIADRRYQWALDQAARGDLAAAADILAQTVELTPGFATAWFALGAIRDRMGDRAGAVAAFEKAAAADPEDYHGARLHLARLGAADTTPEMTATYVRRLFDQHAPNFDASLQGKLGYRGPALLHDAVGRACVARGRPSHFSAMLDLGCGTGLAGAVFRAEVDHIVGVDLSQAMIDEARRKAIYDRLETAELNTFLAAEAAGGARYDLVVAADVFVYMADFRGAAAEVAQVLAPTGLFAFTVESHAGNGMILRETLRYAHAEDYVRDVLTAEGFDILVADRDWIRTEKSEPVAGLVVVAGHN